jgi:hypothetical protein
MIGLVITLFLIVLAIVGSMQVVTKAGYSPWWILLPLSLPVLWLIAVLMAFNSLSGVGTYGFFDLQGITAEAKVLSVIAFLDVLANFVMFLVFAFSDWPVMQAARSRHTPRTGGGAPRSPRQFPGPGSGPASAAMPTPAPGAPPTSPHAGSQAPGWYKSGAVGAGEQSYWDGAAWTAQRRWSDGAWVEIPTVPVGPDGSTPVPPST